jgi:23S rRNA pseudouridine2457 synthase
MKTLIAFNKPFNVVTQFSPHEKYLTLKDFIPLHKYMQFLFLRPHH